MKAPILSLTIERSIEAILAMRPKYSWQSGAAWADAKINMNKLATVDPVTLYHACLNSLSAWFRLLLVR
jgi:hypothetical protein